MSLTVADLAVRTCIVRSARVPRDGAPDSRRAAVAASYVVSLTVADLTVRTCAGAPDSRRAAVAACLRL